MQHHAQKGFTLIEVLVVIGIIGILASIVVVAINPARQFAQANNSQRWSNVNAILNATHQYAVDHNGSLPSGLSSTATLICKSGVATSTCTGGGLVYLDMLVPTYVVGIPTDPTGASGNSTGYTIGTSTGNRVVVSAPSAENGETITVTR